MKRLFACAILFGTLAAAQPAETLAVATIRFHEAMVGTREGRKAVIELQARFDPRKAQLEMRRRNIEELQARVRSASGEQQRAELLQKAAAEARLVERFAADLEADARRETEILEKYLAGKLDAFLAKYADGRGLAMVLDSGAPGNPVRWLRAGLDITAAVVAAYDSAGGR